MLVPADKCGPMAKKACMDANKESCSTGSAACGACKSDFKNDGGSCVGM